MTTVLPEASGTSTMKTATTIVTTSDQKKLHINTAFLRTLHGYMKLLQMVACLLAFVCVMTAGFPYNSFSEADFISFVTVTGLLFSGILLFLFFINAVVFLQVVPWILVEFVYTALWCFFCFVGGIVAATYSSKYKVGDVSYAASAFFLFIAMCFYGFHAFRLYLLHKQGIRLAIVTTEMATTTTVSSP